MNRIALLLAAVAGTGQERQSAVNPTAELTQVTEAWNRAWLKKDIAAAERLMARDYVYIAPSGQLFGRDRVLNILRSPSYQLDSGTRTEIEVKPIDDRAAILINRWRGNGTFEGQRFTDDHRCSIIYTRILDTWQIVLEQCSRNTAKDP